MKPLLPDPEGPASVAALGAATLTLGGAGSLVVGSLQAARKRLARRVPTARGLVSA